MKKEDAKNCWEYWNCPEETRSKCPAFLTDSGKECWFVASSYTAENCPSHKKDVVDCIDCPWYLKSNPNVNKKNSKDTDGNKENCNL